MIQYNSNTSEIHKDRVDSVYFYIALLTSVGFLIVNPYTL